MELTNDFSVPVPVTRAWEVLTDVELIAPCMPGAELQEVAGDEYRGVVKVKVGPITAQYKGAAVFTEKDEAARKLVIDASGRDTRGQGSASAIITLTMSETDGTTDVSVHSDVTIKGKVAQFGRGMIADVSSKLLTQFVECLEGKLEAPASASSAAARTPETPAAPEATVGDDATETAKAQAEASEVTSGATVGDDAAEAAKAQAAEAEADAATGTAPGDAEAPATVGTPATEAAKSADTEAAQAARAADEPTVRKIHQPAEPVDLLDAAGASVAKRVVPVVVVVVLLLLLGKRRSQKRAG